jgi:hypothetical protein
LFDPNLINSFFNATLHHMVEFSYWFEKVVEIMNI